MKARQQSTTTYPIPFLMVLTSDHLTGATGLSPTVTISKNGGAFASPAGAVTELGNGWYLLAGNATDRSTLGELLLHAEAATADPVDERYEIVSWDPFADVAAIKLKTDTIGALAVSITSPVGADGTVSLEQGDSYDVGGSLVFTIAKSALAYSLTGATVTFRCAEGITLTGAVTDDATNWYLTFAPTAAQTAVLTAGIQSYKLKATLVDGVTVKTIQRGALSVARDIPAV